MLGRLARWLRAMGYDTLYPGAMPGAAGDRRLLHLSRVEERLLLTRDRMLARLASPLGGFIAAEQLDEQIMEAVRRFRLAPEPARWLSRCLECNAPLVPREREALAGVVPDHVLSTQERFTACPGCGRVYWPGTHAGRMLERLARLLARARSEP
jgi:uncharacterized protein with PIN domain